MKEINEWREYLFIIRDRRVVFMCMYMYVYVYMGQRK
jgi:hypothetical protein